MREVGGRGRTLCAYESNPLWMSDAKVARFDDGARLSPGDSMARAEQRANRYCKS
jgi:hypothetical protein